jgi:P pilus assembly chaperone PapD
MRRERLRRVIIFLQFVIIYLLLLSSLEAQIYFGVSPIRVELKAKPGSQVTDIFYVRNNSARPMRLKVYAENWFMKEDGTPVFIGNKEVSFSCREWIKVNPFDFRLQPGEMKTVRFTVSVPEGTEAGGYHAAVSFENVPEAPAAGGRGQVAFTGKIAAAVYVVLGRIQGEGSLEDLVFEERGNSQLLRLRVGNSGKTHFRLKGEITIKSAEGKKVSRLEFPDEAVLPETERFILIYLKDKLTAGTYKIEVRLDIGRDELLGLEKEIIVK